MSINIDHWNAISEYYRNQAAKRSKVPYIEHIIKGNIILDNIHALQDSKDAYALHPIFQSDEALNEYLNRGRSYNIILKCAIPKISIVLAMEYRRIANSYLSKNRPEERIPCSIRAVNEMLIADKVQNYTDFLKYHAETHERAAELHIYFNNWLAALGVSKEYFQHLKSLIS